MSPRLVVVPVLPAAIAERAVREFEAVTPTGADLDLAGLTAQLERTPVPAVLITGRLKFDAQAIAALPASVRMVATHSVGYDHIDIGAAERRGLIVTNTPDVLTDATADVAMLLLLNVSRRAADYDAIMRDGWNVRYGLSEMLGVQITGKTLGIVGMGRIGQAMAHRARAFGMKIAYHQRRRLPPELEAGAVFYERLEDLLPVSEVVSLHAAATPGAPPTLDRAALQRLPRGAIVINTARGSLVDEDALIDLVRSGHLWGVGLDVFRKEPDFDRRLRDLPNVFLLPHMGSATVETRNAMGDRALDNVAAFLAGQAPKDRVC